MPLLVSKTPADSFRQFRASFLLSYIREAFRLSNSFRFVLHWRSGQGLQAEDLLPKFRRVDVSKVCQGNMWFLWACDRENGSSLAMAATRTRRRVLTRSASKRGCLLVSRPQRYTPPSFLPLARVSLGTGTRVQSIECEQSRTHSKV